ncbi:MAG: hypothetical protein NWE89_02680 [Candidatus Bathyarchaeota archaeon]|nr:hypothetical protein [Candidatus Bathyarchaeota archaeon]
MSELVVPKRDEEYQANFVKLYQKQAYTMVEFCVNALNSAAKNTQEPLNDSQLTKVIEGELNSLIKDIKNPKLLEEVKKITLKKYRKIEL